MCSWGNLAKLKDAPAKLAVYIQVNIGMCP